MAVTYTPMEIGHMQALADKQGITLEEIKKKRALDEEYSTYVDPKLEAKRKERLGLTAATVSEFEPVFTESATEAAQHQDTSHIGAEERAAGSAIGSAAGAILGGIVGGPVGASAGAAAGKAIGGGGSIGSAATGAIGSGGSQYATEATKKKPGDKPVKDEMMTKIQGVLN